MHMKSKEKDIDFEEQSFNQQFKRIDRQQRPNAPIERALRESKSRITIYLDADIVETFKREAGKMHEGYQTLINRALRKSIAEQHGESLASLKTAFGSEADAVAEAIKEINNKLDVLVEASQK